MANSDLFADFAAMLYRSEIISASQYEDLRGQIRDRGDGPAGLLASTVDQELSEGEEAEGFDA